MRAARAVAAPDSFEPAAGASPLAGWAMAALVIAAVLIVALVIALRRRI